MATTRRGYSTEGRVQFDGDDGSLEYAKAAGIYTEGIEAPLFPDRVVTSRTERHPGLSIIVTFGQSNAANTGEGCYAANGPVYVFNVFDMKFYRAIDPLPGASNSGAAVWGRLGDKLVASGRFPSVLFVPIAVGGSFIREWALGGGYHRRLLFALHRLKMAGLPVDMMLWHQGEADANLSNISSREYRDLFLSIVDAVRRAGVNAPIYIAVATLCATADHPFENRAQIRLGQKRLVSPWRRILPGPDTDLIGVVHRVDGCHFSTSGLERHAQVWFQALTSGRARQWALWAKYRLENLIGCGWSS
jgi:hypothetical protein